MDRRHFLSLALLAGCSGGRGGSSPSPAPRPTSAPAPPPPALPEPLIALNVQPSTALEMLPHVQALGVSHVRVSWHLWHGPEHWAWLPAYHEAGVEVLPLVYGDLDRVLALRQACGDFPYLQIGNEPDGRFENEPQPTYAEGRIVAENLLRFRDVVNAQVVSPGLAWNRAGVTEFLDGLLSVPGAFDVLAIHTYGVHVWGEPMLRSGAVRRAGWIGPLWSTEIGVSDAEAEFAEIDPDEWQVENWQKALSEDPSRHDYERMYAFQLTPDPAGWGLLGMDGRQRPAYHWLRALRGSS